MAEVKRQAELEVQKLIAAQESPAPEDQEMETEEKPKHEKKDKKKDKKDKKDKKSKKHKKKIKDYKPLPTVFNGRFEIPETNLFLKHLKEMYGFTG